MLTLLYHNIVERRTEWLPVAGHQTSAEEFRLQIGRLRSKLLHPARVHEAMVKGETPRGVLITFDDGASGIVEAGKILAENGAVGVSFVCPGALNKGVWFYRLADGVCRSRVPLLRWNSLSISLNDHMEKRAAYKELSNQLFDLPEKARDERLDQILELLGPLDGNQNPGLTTLDEKGLREAADTGGMLFANHSWSHPNLTKLDDSELRREIEDAKESLDCLGLPTLPWFAFPRGSHDRRVRDAAAKSHAFSFGANAHDTETLPRTGIYAPDGSSLRFTIKTAGEGRLRKWLGR